MKVTIGQMTAENAERHYAKDPLTGCWLWKFAKNSQGYGVKGHCGKMWLAHRLVYTILRNEIPDGMHALHTCDNPACVNPYHIFIGTNDDNVRDRLIKNRQFRPTGAANGSSKLNASQVLEIKQSTEKQIVIARKYGVCRDTIRSIQLGKTWSHVSGNQGVDGSPTQCGT